MSQIGKAARDLVQVGRDYIQNIQFNIEAGNWGVALLSSIPLILLLWGTGIGLRLTVNLVENTVSSVLGQSTLTEGQVSIFNRSSSVSIKASKVEGDTFASMFLSNIPLSAYKEGRIKLGESNKGEGSIYLLEKSYSGGLKEYRVNVDGTDLTIALETNPTDVGKFVKGKLYGTVTNGSESRNISLNFVVPVQP